MGNFSNSKRHGKQFKGDQIGEEREDETKELQGDIVQKTKTKKQPKEQTNKQNVNQPKQKHKRRETGRTKQVPTPRSLDTASPTALAAKSV